MQKVTIRLYKEDLDLCRKRAAQYAMSYQAYVREKLHLALTADDGETQVR